MEHFNFNATPVDTITNAPMLYRQGGGIKIKRDDLFAKCGGGSKARMLQYITYGLNPDNCDVIVTAGNPCSNFNRACALQCASLGIKMHLICYTDHPIEFETAINYKICKFLNTEITICPKSSVRETIGKVMDSYLSQGKRAVNIYGGGRSLQGIYSYFDAAKELLEQTSEKETINQLFVACGTGTTVSGILAAFQEFSPQTEIHAISIARNKETELPIIEENIVTLNNYLNSHYDTRNLIFHDEFINGEYGNSSQELRKFIREFSSSTGILVDPIYSGKALYGMSKVLNDLPGNYLFWHTGALYTLCSNLDFIND